MDGYHASNDGKCKAAILRFLSVLLKSGINYSQLDQDNAFLEALMAQLDESASFFNHPIDTLPALMEFLHMLFAVKC
jgi:hypothetical protein